MPPEWTITVTLLVVAILGLAACSDSATPESVATTEGQKDTQQEAPSGSSSEELVRYIHPDEFPVVIGTCIEDEGWPVEISRDGGIYFLPVAPELEEDKQAAYQRCLERYPVDPVYLQPLTDEQLEFLYQWYLTESIPCLEAQGYRGFDPPSLGTFLESEDIDRWRPYEVVLSGPETSMGEWYALNEECPQNPPVDELMGARNER